MNNLSLPVERSDPSFLKLLPGAMVLLFLFSGCSEHNEGTRYVPGYLETELIEIASPEAGYLKELAVVRGQAIKRGEALFELDATVLRLNRQDAQAFSAASSARLEDARQGLRPDEVDALTAELEEAKARLNLANLNVERFRTLAKSGAIPQADLDQAEADFTASKEGVELLEARLRLARIGARDFQQRALEQEYASSQLKESLTQWHEDQAKQKAPVDGFVQDTLYQPGEWVPESRPVVLLRPSDLLRARFFLSPRQLSRIQLGDEVDVLLNGENSPIAATVERISDSPEYTPPIIFSREQTAKLVFLVEARLPVEWARKSHPGQPVSVKLN